MAQVVECLPRKSKALSSTPVLPKEEEGKGEEEEGPRKFSHFLHITVFSLTKVACFPESN
jgi:hypothetical protein